MKAYPKEFLGWFWSVLALLALTGIVLVPGMLALRFELEVPSGWMPGGRVFWAEAHGLGAFCALVLFGSLLPLHVRHGLRQRKNRSTGIALLSTLPLLILTGWGVYYVTDESLARWTSAVHVIVALLISAFLAWHAWRARRIHGEHQSRHQT
jgi:cation transport ATPase